VHQPSWQSWNERTDLKTHEPVLGETPVNQEQVRDWAEGLDIPIGGETVLFVDCEAAFYRTSVPRAVAQVLQSAGYEFGLMGEQWCCGGPAAEMGYAEQASGSPGTTSTTGGPPAPDASSCSTRMTTSASPRTTRSTSVRSSTSRSFSSSSCWHGCCEKGS
jgi:hypothetical protein